LGVANIPVMKSIESPKLAAEAQMKVTKSCQFDGIETMWDWLTVVEALGCEVKIPELGSIPTWSSIVKDRDSLSKLETPDPSADYRAMSAMETTRILIDNLAKEKFLYMTMVSPFTLVGELRGVETLMMDTVIDPDFVSEMLKFATETVKVYCEHFMTSGVDGMILCDPTASGSLISKEDFNRFSQPFIKECGKVIKKSDGYLLTHICGDTSDRLESVVDIGADVFSLDYQVDLKTASMAVGKRQTLLGNVRPPQTLFSGTPKDVEDESRECIRKTGGKGFILGAGCDIAPGTPIENVEVWKTVVRNS
jgi:MtaA/CmuA family methyltransferase